MSWTEFALFCNNSSNLTDEIGRLSMPSKTHLSISHTSPATSDWTLTMLRKLLEASHTKGTKTTWLGEHCGLEN